MGQEHLTSLRINVPLLVPEESTEFGLIRNTRMSEPVEWSLEAPCSQTILGPLHRRLTCVTCKVHFKDGYRSAIHTCGIPSRSHTQSDQSVSVGVLRGRVAICTARSQLLLVPLGIYFHHRARNHGCLV